MKLCCRCNLRDVPHGKDWCGECYNAYQRDWAQKNRVKRLEIVRRYQESEQGKAKADDWRKANAERLADSARERYIANREAIIERSNLRRVRRRSEEPEALLREQREQMRRRRSENAEQYKATARRYEGGRYRSDPQFRIRKLLRGQLNSMFRRYAVDHKPRAHWENLLGYKCAALEERLRSTIPPGYTWDDFLSGKLHIDHIKPVALFNITSTESLEFRECWAITNLQLLPEIENKRKGARYIG